MKKTKNKHRWDETMVIAVMIVSVLCILLMLASYISVTGKAATTAPTKAGVLNMINGATVVTGNGQMICGIACADIQQSCILARNNGQLVTCEQLFTGEYHCLCTSNK